MPAPSPCRSITVPLKAPYNWPAQLAFRQPRAIPGVEEIADGCYRRTVWIEGAPGVLEVRMAGAGSSLGVSVSGPSEAALPKLLERLRHMFNLDADTVSIDAHLGRDPCLAALVKDCPGLRLPVAWDGFELAARAILGQQVSVAAATTLTARLVERFGQPLDSGIISGTNGLRAMFPNPETVAGAPVEEIGIPRKRAQALRAFAAAVAEGQVQFGGPQNLEGFVERLCVLPGIGPWTAHYIALRALGQSDAFPASDLGLLRAFSARKRRTRLPLGGYAERWRPFRAYAALHLWMAN